MGNLKYIKNLEMTISNKISKIGKKELNPSESGIGRLFNSLKDVDEASYEVLIKKYKQTLMSI